MKLFGVLLLILSLLNGGERPCPHALQAQSASEDCHDIVAVSAAHQDHAGMASQAGGHEHPMPEEPVPDCPDDCEGGLDCTGCAALAATIPAATEGFTNPIHNAVFSRSIKRAIANPSVLDPPPPKFPSLI